jgi:hypothetical protein
MLTKRQRKMRHVRELYALGLQKDKFNQLTNIEHKATKLGEDCCNWLSMESPQFNLREKEIYNDLQILFYPKHLPKGFFINHDPRGYALKIRTEDNEKGDGTRVISYTDWGGYGILVPEEYEDVK